MHLTPEYETEWDKLIGLKGKIGKSIITLCLLEILSLFFWVIDIRSAYNTLHSRMQKKKKILKTIKEAIILTNLNLLLLIIHFILKWHRIYTFQVFMEHPPTYMIFWNLKNVLTTQVQSKQDVFYWQVKFHCYDKQKYQKDIQDLEVVTFISHLARLPPTEKAKSFPLVVWAFFLNLI